MVHRQTILERNFDSVLHSAKPGVPARLIIHLKVVLLARDPSTPTTYERDLGASDAKWPNEILSRPGEEPRTGVVQDSSQRGWKCRSWYEAEFNAFRIKFKRMVELAWNNQLILLPPDGSEPGADISDNTLRELISDRNVPAHIRCGLEIAFVPFAHRAGFHVFMEAVRLKEPAGGQFGSFATRITNEDVEFWRTSGTLRQIAAAHEIGHWLGRPVWFADFKTRFLPDIDPDHGRTLSKQMAMMGRGSLLTSYEAVPFLVRAERHTGVLFGWRSIHRVDFDRGAISVSDRQKRLFVRP